MQRSGWISWLLAFTIAVPALGLAAPPDQGTREKAFVPGGTIRMNLSAGDYTIKAGKDDRILVTWITADPDDRASASIAANTKDKRATVITNGPHSNFRVTIEVPARSNLHVDVSAGNLRVEGVTGNKDFGSWAGNIDIEIGKANEYKLVDVAVKAGDIEARPFNANKSGLFRSFRWTGPGEYWLRVRLTAGNLRLIQ